MNKKVLGMLSATVLMSTLSFGATEIKPEAGAKLKVWESDGPEFKWTQMVAKKFEAKYGVKVTAEALPFVDSIKRLGQDGPVGTGADVVTMPHDNLGAGITSGVLMPNLLSERVQKDFLPSAKTAVTGADGKIYGFPLAIETTVLFYNKKLLPNGVKTFEELEAWDVKNKFTNKKLNKFAMLWEIKNLYTSHAFLASQGGYIMGKGGTDYKDIGMNNAGAIKGMESLVSLKKMSLDNPADVDYNTMVGLFNEGKVAAMINGPWAIQGLIDAKTNFGIQVMPTINGAKLNPFSGIRTLAVSSYTKYPKAAQLYAEFATSDEMLMERYKMTKQIPPVATLAKNPIIANDPISKTILAQAGQSTPMPSIPQMGMFWDPLSAAINDVWMGKATPKSALDLAVKTIKEQIALQK